jgi:hypothetical protein
LALVDKLSKGTVSYLKQPFRKTRAKQNIPAIYFTMQVSFELAEVEKTIYKSSSKIFKT